jgi:hypothetical protein
MGEGNGISTLSEGISLLSGDPYSVTPAAVQVPVPRLGRGWAYVTVVTAAHASDTTTVAIHGKLNASDSYRALKQSDQSTAASVAQSGGAAVSTMFTCQLMPYMKVVLSGTSTSGASTKVWLEAVGQASRSDA